ncbi:MlaC/ttg2D family ABC transporter substrate-binding protein [Pseudoroseomonas ludipueritiae]|uniref:ABC transporter substrate-binding protein n=1 Tax=Pseudoroseomonas ludipueritiae TaxID=198093 RepID=A0ABR7R3N3_9PROT|nr:ABC transporter substrate-binding protein [Pseudoroseomonas ludipueritiae]MBC9176294.1 ABC transporter substrate-binding protein [Pseudoroseomonas ludipueritiae]MCG7361597.1 ABC transporter substrate-binding protein [Roseomonas sp. ACRSG]
MNRRILLASILATPFASAAIRPAHAEIDINRAVQFIQATGQDMVAAINARQPVAARRQRVASILRQAVDIDGVGRFILGRWWRVASPAEQQEYMQLFEETLIRNLSARFGEYEGVRFNLGRSQQRTEDDVLVNTIIERPGQAAFNLDWRVGEVNGQPRVVDVIAEGTSLRLTQRSEYSAVISRNGGQVAPLLAAMRQQIAALAAREGR